ncbi:conserved hypothetical secreted protein [Azoarcus olearius]|uniref:Conserved hypothetical secreted protein n=2 Tax=Azoarcus sp. (strain BH72) TaxID=418699 RepID=A1K8Y2_AZOSB|nr:conserved hypothetical secreted protein [Azoarcus olearius]
MVQMTPQDKETIMKAKLLTFALCSALLTGAALAQDAMPPIPDDAPIYGSQIMTPQERIEHRDRMRAARTLEEREKVRAEHHEQMVKRAKERGVTLPEEPPMRGGAMGPGGRGPGGGMGPDGRMMNGSGRPDSRPGY